MLFSITKKLHQEAGWRLLLNILEDGGLCFMEVSSQTGQSLLSREFDVSTEEETGTSGTWKLPTWHRSPAFLRSRKVSKRDPSMGSVG